MTTARLRGWRTSPAVLPLVLLLFKFIFAKDEPVRTAAPTSVLYLIVMSACSVAPMDTYEPAVDHFSMDPAQYSRDLTECRSVAASAMAQAEQRQEAQMGSNILTGMLVGAAIGNVSALGTDSRKDSTKQGALLGALAGAAESGEDVKLGPRRIMDRCIANRGYVLLNDTP